MEGHICPGSAGKGGGPPNPSQITFGLDTLPLTQVSRPLVQSRIPEPWQHDEPRESRQQHVEQPGPPNYNDREGPCCPTESDNNANHQCLLLHPLAQQKKGGE